MRTLHNSTDLSQLDRTERLGMSLGVWNYCLNAPVGKSLVKRALFQSGLRKFKYVFAWRPTGVARKMSVSDASVKSTMDAICVCRCLSRELTLPAPH